MRGILFALPVLLAIYIGITSGLGLKRTFRIGIRKIRTRTALYESMQPTTSHIDDLKGVSTAMMQLGVPDGKANRVVRAVKDIGIEATAELLSFSRDFANRPEVLTKIFQDDFHLSAIDAHTLRSAVMQLLRSEDFIRFSSGDDHASTIDDIVDSSGSSSRTEDNAANMVDAATPEYLQLSSKLAIPISLSKRSTDGESTNIDSIVKPKPIAYQDFIVSRRRTKEASPSNTSVSDFSTFDSTFSSKVATVDSSGGAFEYGLKKSRIPKRLSQEIKEFELFMTDQNAKSQEAIIRLATAEVYIRHCRQFLGWYIDQRFNKKEDSVGTAHANADEEDAAGMSDKDGATASMKAEERSLLQTSSSGSSTGGNSNGSLDELSLHDIFPNKERGSSQVIFDFIKWLRANRQISSSYEANLLRGLIKLCKYRFANDSTADPSYGEKSFEDIPMIKELRKLHREANKKRKLSPRVSDEKKKWISWTEFLQVVQTVKLQLESEIEAYNHKVLMKGSSSRDDDSDPTPAKKDSLLMAAERSDVVSKSVVGDDDKNNNAEEEDDEVEGADIPLPLIEERQKRRIAALFQRYLLLAFYTCIPDRQRTFRELEIGRTFIRREDESDSGGGGQRGELSLPQKVNWIIKHGVDDYKTGKSYGERPPLVLSHALTPAIDAFITYWRPLLKPSTLRLFAQPRTGKPLTQLTVYDMVARTCFDITGKKTNPHLLRDIIVTHVRDTEASERELEALALYMGHSIAMQRSSYDRRTLSQKVSPAVSLLESISMQAAATGFSAAGVTTATIKTATGSNSASYGASNGGYKDRSYQ